MDAEPFAAATAAEELVDRYVTAEGTEFVLVRCGESWLVRVAGRALMSSEVHDSEEALAAHALESLPDAQQVLVGGLGLGFTLRAVLDRVADEAHVTVVELLPSLLRWNREHVGELAEHPLDDPRTDVVLGDVLETIRESTRRFDAIVLDVDNGPVALSSSGNAQLYSSAGVRACHRALRPDGVLAVWSAGPSARFERTLESCGFQVDVVRASAREGARARHVLFIARRLAGGPAQAKRNSWR